MVSSVLCLTLLTFKKTISYLMSVNIEDTTHIEDLLVGECGFRDLEELSYDSQHCCHVSVVPESKRGSISYKMFVKIKYILEVFLLAPIK